MRSIRQEMPMRMTALETAAGVRRRRARWPAVVLGVYLLLVAGAYGVVAWVVMGEALSGSLLDGNVMMVLIPTAVLAAAQVGLLLPPVGAWRGRPVDRRSWVVPLVASGVLFGVLLFGILAAVTAAAWGDRISLTALWTMIATGALAWVPWTVLFWRLGRRRAAGRVTAWLNRVLIAGSILELCVAVPCHIIVRRRNECCATMMTGSAIMLGAAVGLIAFGPGVVWLYLKRVREITPRDEGRGFEVVVAEGTEQEGGR